MKSLREIKIENAGYDDRIDWIEFKGTKKETVLSGKIVDAPKDKDYVKVEYVVSYVATARVHRAKIIGVRRP